ncbi:MAG: 30S ribosomal protein S4 [Thaumarchaeota archaeon]|nr:30S ribosomal protein S4 [Nitrososphaerota archaeon]MCL5318413.1 30S ribosomal protein S4 [Nitrososphaerota archaeon]
MGDPKKSRKKFSTPRNQWQADQLSRELHLMGTYGLRNKRELWRTETELSRIRKQARELLAQPVEERLGAETKLLKSLSRKGIISEAATLDDILGLTVENLLDRRLQSMVKNKGLAPTIHKARQIVTHGHIKVKDRVITIPGYLVMGEEEPTVRVREGSTIMAAVKPEAPAQ